MHTQSRSYDRPSAPEFAVPACPYEAKFDYLFNPRETLNETFKGNAPASCRAVR